LKPYQGEIKMKNRLMIPLLVILTMLTACGKTGEQAPYQAADAKALVDAGAFSGSMTEVDNKVVPLLYGLEEDTIAECSCYTASNTSVSADEVAVFVMEDADGASAALEACKQRVEAQIDVCKDYCPDQVPRLEKAVILQRGNTVLLAVGTPEKLPQALKDLNLGG